MPSTAAALASSVPDAIAGMVASVGCHFSPSQRHRPSSDRVALHCRPSHHHLPSSENRPAVASVRPGFSDTVLPPGIASAVNHCPPLGESRPTHNICHGCGHDDPAFMASASRSSVWIL